MRATLTATLVLFAFAIARYAVAADMYALTDGDKKFLAEIVDATSRKDVAWIAEHMVYPVSIVASNETRTVKTKAEFAAVLSRELTDSACAKIAVAAKQPPFKNWQGVVIGDGILWFSEYRRDEHTSWTYGIFSIEHFASQPKEGANKMLQTTREAAGPQ